ncbi:hypothetical protein KKG83_03440 [Candidatus Micrarchaeota archaeon]|nr:hypothetical protein [Candidatus Micrarchaeota archaeon]MBU2476499.1 hypothetical protein [Candidatus Micrarchaeota archaeon]
MAKMAFQKKGSPKRYFRAVLLPFKTALSSRRYPKPLSGTKRRLFSINAFVAEVWKYAAGRKRLNPDSFLAAEAFSKHVCRIDDILDQVNTVGSVTEIPKWKRDDKARAHISDFVHRVKEMPLTTAEKKQVFRIAGEFRREANKSLIKFKKNSNPTKKDVISLKEKTTGSSGKALVSLLNVCERIPRKQAIELEEAFSNIFMAAQVADDILDLREDQRARTPNLALEFLKDNPLELKSAMKKSKMNMLWFKRNCKISYAQLIRLCNSYISKVPQTTVGFQTLATLPKLFLKLLFLPTRSKK